jgi:hypothetical protein
VKKGALEIKKVAVRAAYSPLDGTGKKAGEGVADFLHITPEL